MTTATPRTLSTMSRRRFEDDDKLASKFQNLQEKVVGSLPSENLTPLQQAEQVAMEMEVDEDEEEDDDEHIIEEDYDDGDSEPQEELIDITKQSEITDDDGIILDDVIDSIINDMDDIKNS